MAFQNALIALLLLSVALWAAAAIVLALRLDRQERAALVSRQDDLTLLERGSRDVD